MIPRINRPHREAVSGQKGGCNVVDWQRVLREMQEMRDYFANRAVYAEDGSKEKEQLIGYVCALIEVAQAIRAKIAEEDDRK